MATMANGRVNPAETKMIDLQRKKSHGHQLTLLFYVKVQGSHRLEKYLNIQDCLEMSLKIKFAMKILENTQRP